MAEQNEQQQQKGKLLHLAMGLGGGVGFGERGRERLMRDRFLWNGGEWIGYVDLSLSLSLHLVHLIPFTHCLTERLVVNPPPYPPCPPFPTRHANNNWQETRSAPQPTPSEKASKA